MHLVWVGVLVGLLLLVAVFALWKPKKPVSLPTPEAPGAVPAANPSCCCLAGTAKGCHHTLCCDSLCPSLSQYYDPLTQSCMERPQMPYGYDLAGGPCVTAFQWCSANPPQPVSLDMGVASEQAPPCGTLCDRFGGSLYYTGFTGVAAMKPAFIPSTYDEFETVSTRGV